ncbi:MAG: heavy metal translocating P-type ATPase [Candidatus Thermoplasmatota archaeon]|nr:heavy metal translocating P-type ATPase [Candidatus Thermoplasmatota archaeon]
MAKKDRKNVKLKISGMTCAMCSKAVEKALSGLDGVQGAEVNLGNETASLDFDPGKVNIAEMETAVKDAGYNVVNSKTTIKIGGMTCVMCVRAVEKAVGELDSVTEVSVNLTAEKAYISYNSELTGIQDMKRAVEGAGYKFLGVDGEDQGDAEKEMREAELKWKMIRFIVGFALAAPMMVLMYLMKLDIIVLKPPIPLGYIYLIITTPAFIFVSYPIFVGAFKALKNKNLDMNVMYSMGIGVAYVSSILGTFELILTKNFMFYDTALMLAAFLMLGRFLEARAKGRTSEAIKKLMGLRPKTATVLRGNNEIEIDIDEVQVGDIVIIKPGEKIPVDGVVVKGESYVDESMITGEPIPPLRTIGNNVIGGTLNKNSVLRVEAGKVGKETMLAQIIQLVEDAQGSRPPVQRLADKVVTFFIPVILLIAILSFIGWFLLAGESLLFSLTVLISILVVACPCALGLATPTAVTVGIGRGAELGILIKNGEALQVSEKLTSILFDKTGTLTQGKPEVTDIYPIGMDEKELILMAASVERNSQHPLGDAVVKKAKKNQIKLKEISDFDTFGGKGITAKIGKREIIIGNRALFEERNISYKNETKKILGLENQGKTVILIARDSKLCGIIAIADTLKKTTKDAIKELKNMKLKVYMITGDNKRTANAIAKQIGIKNILAEVLPQDKAREVRELQKKGELVAFVGDGINDAPALAQADVGIAMGGGTDVAMESGDIVLIKDDIMDAVSGIRLSKKVMGRIKQNLFWAFAYNTALVPLAAGGLHLLFGITFPPELAGGAMAMSSVTVVTLSLMLKKYTPPSASNKNNRQ